jgi:hypothetical protein
MTQQPQSMSDVIDQLNRDDVPAERVARLGDNELWRRGAIAFVVPAIPPNAPRRLRASAAGSARGHPVRPVPAVRRQRHRDPRGVRRHAARERVPRRRRMADTCNDPMDEEQPMTNRVPRWDDPMTTSWLDMSPKQREAARAVHNKTVIVLGIAAETGEPVMYRDTVHIPAVEDELIRAERRDDEEGR